MPKYSATYLEKRIKWYYECWKHVDQANYQKATAHAKLGLKLFPDDTVAAFTYYSILADYATINKTKKFQSMHKMAVKEMKKLLLKTSNRGISLNFKRTMKNEVYFQTKEFKKQYLLGIYHFKKHKNKYAMYSAGVGSANYALELAKKRKKAQAEMWAKKSVKAWEVYFEVDKRYYNSYVHLALAYGIVGDFKKMERSLKKSAKLSGKGAEYREFQEVREEVRGLVN